MHLTYEVTEADALAYASHFYDTSPTIQRQIRTGRRVLGVAAVLFALVAVLLFIGGQCVRLNPWIGWLLNAAIILAVVVVLVFLLHKRIYMYNSRRMLRDGKNNWIFGRQTMTLLDTGIRVTRSVGETTTFWSGIERIESSSDTTYVYISSMAAYFVPKASVVEGDYDTFVAELRGRHAAASHPPA